MKKTPDKEKMKTSAQKTISKRQASGSKHQFYIAADHAGYILKERIKQYLTKKKILYEDLSPQLIEGDDYPDRALAVAKKVASNSKARGILICGTGFGMAIVANKVPKIRAVSPYSVHAAKMSRLHNDANILALGGRDGPSEKENLAMLDAWITTSFDNEVRHKRRNKKIRAFEQAVTRTSSGDVV